MSPRKPKTENVVNAPASASSQPTTERNPPLTHRQILAACLADPRFSLFKLSLIQNIVGDALKTSPSIASSLSADMAATAVAKHWALQYGHEVPRVLSLALADARFDKFSPTQLQAGIMACQEADKEWHKRGADVQLVILALYFHFLATSPRSPQS